MIYFYKRIRFPKDIARCIIKVAKEGEIFENNGSDTSGGFTAFEMTPIYGRHNSSLLDAHILKPGDDTEDIPDSYVIFIAENDVMKGAQPLYPVKRYVVIGENKVLFGDGSHILYEWQIQGR